MTRVTQSLTLLLLALALLGIAFSASPFPTGGAAAHGTAVRLPVAQNNSNGGDPSGSAASLCPSAGGPVILWVQWNCVAVLNLAEVALILASLGIVAYVFKGAESAELPGESTNVPVTAAEWDAYRRARKLGDPYEPPESPDRQEER